MGKFSLAAKAARKAKGALDESGPAKYRKAYHGSPHKFDKFSTENIGTGEGAAAYGHGLYFAESEGVAKSYQSNFSQNAYQNNDKNYARALESGLSAGDFDAFESSVRYHGGNATPDSLTNEFFKNNKEWSHLKSDPVEYNNIREFAKDYLANLPDANLYEVDIPESSVAKMLDWDAPLSEQPEIVKKGLKALIDEQVDHSLKVREGFNAKLKAAGKPLKVFKAEPGLTGSKLYDNLVEKYRVAGATNPQVMASKELNSLGIPGIKYLDGNSRTAGEGTQNFVLFDDKQVAITSRNGIPGALASDDPDLLRGVGGIGTLGALQAQQPPIPGALEPTDDSRGLLDSTKVPDSAAGASELMSTITEATGAFLEQYSSDNIAPPGQRSFVEGGMNDLVEIAAGLENALALGAQGVNGVIGAMEILGGIVANPNQNTEEVLNRWQGYSYNPRSTQAERQQQVLMDLIRDNPKLRGTLEYLGEVAPDVERSILDTTGSRALSHAGRATLEMM